MTTARRPRKILPLSLPPRGLSREQAAEYVGVSPSFFDTLVADGRMPKPTTVNTKPIWDRIKLDHSFDALADLDDDVDDWQVAA